MELENLYRESSIRALSKKKESRIKQFRESVDFKTYMQGMMIAKGRIKLKSVSRVYRIKKRDLKRKIFEMNGTGELSGIVTSRYFYAKDRIVPFKDENATLPTERMFEIPEKVLYKKKIFRKNVEFITYLKGMMKAKGKCKLKKVGRVFGLKKKKMKRKIVELIGKGEISGTLTRRHLYLSQNYNFNNQIIDGNKQSNTYTVRTYSNHEN